MVIPTSLTRQSKHRLLFFAATPKNEGNIMLMNEVFNSTVNIDWTENNDIATGIFRVNDLTFKIKLERDEYTFKDKTYTYVNIGFTRADDNGEWTTNLIGNEKSSPKIYGAILNGVRDKLKGAPFDVLMFGALDHIKERMSLYNRIIGWLQGGEYPNSIENIQLPGGRVCSLLFKNTFKDKGILDDFKKYLAGLDKTKNK